MFASIAQASEVAWKLYGWPSTDDGDTVCFYEAIGVTQTPNRHLRVWTKCLLQKDIEGIDINSDVGRKIVENAARKLADKYIPPIAIVNESIDYDKAIMVMHDEEAANVSGIKPHARFFYELDCSEKMARRLDTYIVINGKSGFSHKPSDWEYAGPKGAGTNLLEILCGAFRFGAGPQHGDQGPNAPR